MVGVPCASAVRAGAIRMIHHIFTYSSNRMCCAKLLYKISMMSDAYVVFQYTNAGPRVRVCNTIL